MEVIHYTQSGQESGRSSYTYDDKGNVTSFIDGENTTLYEYKEDRLIKATYSDQISTYTYNENNELSEMIKTQEGETVGSIQYEYDSSNNLIKMITNNNGKITEAIYTYDQANQVIEANSMLDDVEYKTVFEYDQEGNCIKETAYINDVLDLEITSVYENGLMISQTQKNPDKQINVETQYKYNDDNQVIEELSSEDGSKFFKNREYIYK